MAVTKSMNVIKMTADNDTHTGSAKIRGIRTIAGGAGGLTAIKSTNTSGFVLYQTTQSASAETFEEVRINVGSGETIHLDTVDATVWLYLE